VGSLVASAACAPRATSEVSPATAPAPKAGANDRVPTEDAVDRLSVALRERRLDADERRSLQDQLRTASADAVYTDALDRWLTRDAYRHIMERWLPFVRWLGHGGRARDMFITSFVRRRDASGTWVHFIEDVPPGAGHAGAPETGVCPPAARSLVAPWWAPHDRIWVCNDSYRPESVFDDVGYCAGQPEPTVPSPPRRGCACGPLLLACFPPEDEAPGLAERVDAAATDEVVETATEIAASGRSLDELLTTSRTWQTGLTKFLYARREWIGLLANEPWSDALEVRLRRELDAVRLDAPGEWVERRGIYAGSGVFTSTPLVQATSPQYRTTMRALLEEVLCTPLKGLNVNSTTLLNATSGQHRNIRPLKVHESPMRSTPGCSGCHAPMDNGAAFLVGLRTALFGAYPTGDVAAGRLYVNGANDYRGSGQGFADLGRLLAAQPEFDTCALNRTWYTIIGEYPRAPERAQAEAVAAAFHAGGRRFPFLARAVLLSPTFRSPHYYVHR